MAVPAALAVTGVGLIAMMPAGLMRTVIEEGLVRGWDSLETGGTG